RALRAARVVLAGHVLVRRERVPLGSRAGHDVVLVWPVLTRGNYFAFFGEIVLLAELVVRAMQVIDAGRDHDAFDVLPGALADAVARVDCAGPLRGEVAMPRLAASACGLRQSLAMPIGAREPTKISALARA